MAAIKKCYKYQSVSSTIVSLLLLEISKIPLGFAFQSQQIRCQDYATATRSRGNSPLWIPPSDLVNVSPSFLSMVRRSNNRGRSSGGRGGGGSGRRNSSNGRRRRPRSPPPPIPLPGQPGRGCFRQIVSASEEVWVVQKEHQRSGQETKGTIQRLLTNSPYHPRGIKVMLTSGQVGRVTRIVEEETIIEDEILK